MQVTIRGCSYIDHSLKNYDIVRSFRVNDSEMESLQACYFDRFIPELEKICYVLLDKFKDTSISCLFIDVSCHGYNHKYDFKNGKIVIAK